MKRWNWIVALLLIALPVLWFRSLPSWEERTVAQFEEDRAVLEELAQQILEQDSTEGIVLPTPWYSVDLYKKGIVVVDFHLGSGGFASETVYCGVNYVPDDSNTVGFQGRQWDYWKPQGDGRLYYDPEGDNTCYVRKLAPCWYYYEMKF